MSRKDIDAGAGANFAIEVIARRLTSFEGALPVDLARLRGRLGPIERWGRGATLGALGHRPVPRVLVSGWACRHTINADGRRQIVGFILPGDFIGLRNDASWSARCEIETLTPAATVCARRLLASAVADSWEALEVALREVGDQHNSNALRQIIRLGAQTAHKRVAGLLLELHERLQVVELVRDDAFHFPLTHEQLADATGLSAVHINRVLQDLKRQGIINLDRRRLEVRRLDLLSRMSDAALATARDATEVVTPLQKRQSAPIALLQIGHGKQCWDRASEAASA